jgi:uncharacterized protein
VGRKILADGNNTNNKDIRIYKLLLMLAFIVMHSLYPFVSRNVYLGFIILSGIMTLYAGIKSWHSVLHLGLLYTIMNACWLVRFLRTFLWSPYPVALAVYMLLIGLFRPLRKTASWLQRGSASRTTLWWMIGIVTISSTALVIWFLAAGPDVSAIQALVTNRNPFIILGSILGVAIMNAIVEEFIFDGVCYGAFETVVNLPAIVIAIQAFSYGMAHYFGVPRGWLGVAMAFLYGGAMLGFLRYQTRGLLYPIIAHVFADITIGLLVFYV